jgi:hypothetical protein
MMPGPRVPPVRPTKPGFTLKSLLYKNKPTVAPRNNRRHTVRVRRTAGNLARRISNLPGHIQRMEALEASQMGELERVRAQYSRINTNFTSNRVRTEQRRMLVSSARLYGTLLRQTRQILQRLRDEKHRINTYKVPSLTLREPSMNELMGSAGPSNAVSAAVPELPGVPEENNRNE